MCYCAKIQGYSVKLVEHFALRFNEFHETVVGITFQVTEETLSAMTEIPPHGERSSKGIPLDVLCYEEFIKTNCMNEKIRAGVPSWYIQETFQKLLKVIRRYFTCERRYDRIYAHHIRMLMHFTGKRPLNLPFFLHRSLERMTDNIQAEADQPRKNLFHISLIKLLVVEELRWMDKYWDSFLILVNIPKGPKGDLPLPMGEKTSRSAGTRMEETIGKGKKIEGSSSQYPVPWKRGKMRLIKKPEETQAPNELHTQSIVEKLLMCVVRLEPVEVSSRGISERQRRSGNENMEVQEPSQ
jgi:hypothetical protein